MAMTSGSSGGIKNEINVTPLVDVVLVLLIIFMVVTPMLQRGKDVRLPKAKTTDEVSAQNEPLVLTVTPQKEIYLDAFPYGTLELELRIKELLGRNPDRKVLLKGDASLTVGDVRKVMDVARKAGAKGVALGVEELKTKK